MSREIPDHCEEFRRKPGAGDEGKDDRAGIYHDNTQYHRRGRVIDTWIFKNNTWGLRCRLGNTAATGRIAIFPLRLLLFYIVYNGGKSGSVRLSRVHQPSLSGKKGKPLCKR